MARLSPQMTVMQAAARLAARRLLRDFEEVEKLQVTAKGPSDFVSQADLRAEATLKAELDKARPGYAFLMEESGASGSDAWTWRWIVDPLDGTTNFLHGIPHFAINIALERADVGVVAAVTYNPITHEMFWAEKGKGCFVNEHRLRVAARQRMDEAVLATGIPFLGHGQHAKFLKELHQITQRVAGVRRFGAASLDMAWVAAGRFDGYWERDLKPWDLAAGVLLITEAGGKVTDAEGGADVLATGSVAASNLDLHPQLVSRLTAAK